MTQIIASTYEIVQEIGSGGSGIVYLARHQRLGKWVVLKADKRTLSTRPEVLRREVDAMKNLSHTYIPQVYDFIVADETVYTVMDYVEGESLDKLLKRGQHFPQSQVIEWACQLLEALCYLHSRPPHGILHSDIKPANIMLTPQGDIRLIDFNIALALGEEGAVRVGFSSGYASPEHYGVDYVAGNVTRGNTDDVVTRLPTSSAETILSNQVCKNVSSAGPRKQTILLDVRSDIYSLGATLYHLLTGKRPAQNAREVAPISSSGVSPAVAAIVKKAMAPDADQRYQSAAEMLAAFEHLHENDPRMKRHKRRSIVTAAVLTIIFLAGGLCTFVGLKQMEKAQEAARITAEAAEAAERTAKEALAAVNHSKDAYRNGDIPTAVNSALEALALDTPYNAQAQAALTAALGIYDLSDGFKAHLLLALPSEPLKVVLSPEGTRVAVMTMGEALVFDTESGEQLVSLETEASALADITFAGENVCIYAGDGALCAYNLAQKDELWTAGIATGITLSADGSTVAAVYRDENIATIYDVATGATRRVVTFQNLHQSTVTNDVLADPGDNLFALNENGTLLAVSFSNGSLRIFDLRDSKNDLEIYDASEFTHFEGGFYKSFLAFSATGSERSVFAVIDVERTAQTGGFSSTMPFHVQTNERGIYVSTENILVKLDPVTGEQTEVAYTDADITAFDIGNTYTITATGNKAFAFFGPNAELLAKYEDGVWHDFVQMAGDFAVTACLDMPSLQVLKLEKHPEAQMFSYDASYSHSEARISADEETVMLFRYDRFKLYDINGDVLADVDIPDAEEVYDQQYRRHGAESYLEVTYNSGLIRNYSAQDGSLLSEINGEKPDGTLYEEFLTDHLKVTSPLHGTPAAYDRETGELVKELEKDAYLTYVTQVGEYVITEYITMQGERYGLLLDEHCETLAYLPNLCDITVDGRLIFDDMTGNLRESRIYSIQELIALAKN